MSYETRPIIPVTIKQLNRAKDEHNLDSNYFLVDGMQTSMVTLVGFNCQFESDPSTESIVKIDDATGVLSLPIDFSKSDFSVLAEKTHFTYVQITVRVILTSGAPPVFDIVHFLPLTADDANLVVYHPIKAFYVKQKFASSNTQNSYQHQNQMITLEGSNLVDFFSQHHVQYPVSSRDLINLCARNSIHLTKKMLDDLVNEGYLMNGDDNDTYNSIYS